MEALRTTEATVPAPAEAVASGVPRPPRVYHPFRAWLFAGRSEHDWSGYYGARNGIPLESLRIGETERDERALSRGYGLEYYRNVFEALRVRDAGRHVARLECRGPINSTETRCRQRVVLWVADAGRVLHEFALWCAEQRLQRLRSAAAREEWGVVLQAKRDAIENDQNAYALRRERLFKRDRGRGKWPADAVLDETTYWYPPEHAILDAVCEGGPLRCAIRTHELVRLAIPDTGKNVSGYSCWTDRNLYIIESRKWLVRRLLALAPEHLREPDEARAEGHPDA